MLTTIEKIKCDPASDTQEKWLPVVGFEGSYEVSDHGRVKSLARSIIRSNGRIQTFRERILGHSIITRGYLRLPLAIIGRQRKNYLIHRLVVEAFLPDYSKSLQVDHIDGNTGNNHLSNLRMLTKAENLRAYNRPPINSSSRYRGVSWDKKSRKWRAIVKFNRRNVYLGEYDSELEAAKTWNDNALKYGYFPEALNLFTDSNQ